jgi:hypothetical protein
MFVWSGSAWVSVAAEVESLAGYATQSYADNIPGTKLIVPSSVAVGSGSGSVATQGTVSFSTASSVSVNNCFSSTYDMYKVIIDITASTADANLTWKMRTGGTDNSSGWYYGQVVVDSIANTVAARTASGAGTSWLIGTLDAVGTSNLTSLFIDVAKPFNATYTGFGINGNSINTSNVIYGTAGGANHAVNISYDGFSVIASAGTISGTIRVYGYKN